MTTETKNKGKATAESTPGDHDLAMAAGSNPSTAQVTQQGGQAVEAEGERLRQQAEADRRDDAPVTLASALSPEESPLKYDEAGVLTNQDGKRIALAADALDPDVGWTIQHAGSHLDEGDRRAFPGGYSSTPDQTFHPDELPDPLAAIQAGLLPQNVEVLNIDPAKFEGKKSLEP